MQHRVHNIYWPHLKRVGPIEDLDYRVRSLAKGHSLEDSRGAEKMPCCIAAPPGTMKSVEVARQLYDK